MQHKYILSLGLLFSIAGLVACGGSPTATNGSDSGIAINGIVTSNGDLSLSGLPLGIQYAAPASCPDDQSGGLAVNLSPIDGSFKIATKHVRLLMADSDDHFEMTACTNDTATDAETNMVTLSDASTAICDLDEIPEEALATYDGMELAVYFIEMTVSMIVPQIADEKADYRLRIYFNNDEENGILARDVLVYDEAQSLWGWVDWDDLTQLAYVGVDARPNSLLDGFANDEFWCADCAVTPELCAADEAEWRVCSADNPTWSYKDPVTISTENTNDGVSGSDFSMSGTFTIADATESHTITMAFDVANTLSVWEAEEDLDDVEHTLDITRDCGFHPLFPSVTVTDATE